MLDKFKGNIYYSEVLKSTFIVIDVKSLYNIEIKLLDQPYFKSSDSTLPIGHANTTIFRMNEREPIGKMDIMQLVELYIIPKS